MAQLVSGLKIHLATAFCAALIVAGSYLPLMAAGSDSFIVMGDVNQDGLLTPEDLPLFLDALENPENLLQDNELLTSDDLMQVADFNRDGILDRQDLLNLSVALLDQDAEAETANASDDGIQKAPDEAAKTFIEIQGQELTQAEFRILLVGLNNPGALLDAYPELADKGLTHLQIQITNGQFTEALTDLVGSVRSRSLAENISNSNVTADASDVPSSESSAVATTKRPPRQIHSGSRSGGGGGGSVGGGSVGGGGGSTGGGGGSSAGGGGRSGGDVAADAGGSSSSDTGGSTTGGSVADAGGSSGSDTGGSTTGGSVADAGGGSPSFGSAPPPDDSAGPGPDSFDAPNENALNSSTGIFGGIAASVIVIGGVDIVTWDHNSGVEVVYGAQTLDNLVVPPTQSAVSSELLPYIGSFVYTTIPEDKQGEDNRFILLRVVDPGTVTLKLWSRASDPMSPNRHLADWTPTVTSTADPSIGFD